MPGARHPEEQQRKSGGVATTRSPSSADVAFGSWHVEDDEPRWRTEARELASLATFDLRERYALELNEPPRGDSARRKLVIARRDPPTLFDLIEESLD